MPEMRQREELSAFLRARREASDPVAFGFQPARRRRTPGLRREELAQLAGVSVTWYTWLEQGREIGVSRSVVERLATALRMSPPERAHLFALAGLHAPAGSPVLDEPGILLRRLVDTLDPNPAYIVNPWWDLLAYNRAYSQLLGDLNRRPVLERNALWLLFTDASTRAVFEDWTAEARRVVGQLRVHRGLYPDDPRGGELVDLLMAASPRFAELWQAHEVSGFEPSRKRLQVRDGRQLELNYVKLSATADGRQQLLVFLPADDVAAAILKELALEPT